MSRPKFIAFSPLTQVDVGIDSTAVSVEVLNIAAFPDVGAGEFGYITFSKDKYFVSQDPADYETATYTGKSGGTLTGLTRGVEGVAQAWIANDWCFSGKTKHSDDLVFDHIDNTTTAHGAVSAATASKIMIRDADGRARVATPSHNDDIANKSYADTMLLKAGGTMTGEIIMADQLLTRPLLKDYGETAVVATGVTGNQTINLENGNVIQHTLSGATAYTFSNPPATGRAGSFTLVIIQPATALAVTWPASVRWVGGNLPVLSVSSGRYVLTFMTVDAGTVWYGFVAGDDMKAAS